MCTIMKTMPAHRPLMSNQYSNVTSSLFFWHLLMLLFKANLMVVFSFKTNQKQGQEKIYDFLEFIYLKTPEFTAGQEFPKTLYYMLSEVRSKMAIFLALMSTKISAIYFGRTTIRRFRPRVFWSIPSACGIRHTLRKDKG